VVLGLTARRSLGAHPPSSAWTAPCACAILRVANEGGAVRWHRRWCSLKTRRSSSWPFSLLPHAPRSTRRRSTARCACSPPRAARGARYGPAPPAPRRGPPRLLHDRARLSRHAAAPDRPAARATGRRPPLRRSRQVQHRARRRVPGGGGAPRQPLRRRRAMSNAVLEAIRSRRMVRALTDAPVPREQVEQILEAARWAPSAGNRRLHHFVAIQDAVTLRLLRMVSPGMFQRPRAVIAICIDGQRARSFGMSPTARGLY